jgi:outer membrane lipoprotein-sorting protein
MWLYSPSIEQVDKISFQSSEDSEAARLHQMFLGFGPKTEEVLKAYDVRVIESNEKTLILKFIPLIENISSEIEYVDITFDKAQLLPREIVWLTPDQDKTTIEMKSIKKNAKLPKNIFKPDFPKNTTILER